MTCTTCLTLNPPAAPACVRCNTPLEPAAGTGPAPATPATPAATPTPAGPAGQDPTEGSKRIGPGLSAAAKGTPGSSRARAAAVQPPGYGLDTGGGEPPAPAAPVEEPRIARRVGLAGELLVVAVLVAGGVLLWLTRPVYLDSGAVQRQLGDQLTARLGGPVAVSCPGDQRRWPGVTFRCTATDNAGGRRAVIVTVTDNSGNYTWTLGTA
jgi:Domain of unknown function (DUF4333)